MNEQTHYRRLRHQLPQQLELLADQLAFKECHASRITVRPIETLDQAHLHRIDRADEGNRNHLCGRNCCERGLRANCRNHRHIEVCEFGCQLRKPLIATLRPAKCDVEVLPLDIAGLPQPLAKAGQWHFRCARERAGKKSDHWYRRLLRVRRERPCGSRAAEKGDEFAPPHSITLSVRASSVGETSRPSALAVIRLMTKSNLVGCSTGISPGFAPRRILST